MNRLTGPLAATALIAGAVGLHAQPPLPPEIPDASGVATSGMASGPISSRLNGRIELDQLAQDQRYSGHLNTQRLIGDFRGESSVAGAGTLRISDRFEAQARTAGGQERSINILRELYLSGALPWAPEGGNCDLDFGRLNWKLGDALWYSPIDYFKRNASVSSAAMTPSSIRENRLGAFMLRIQCGAGRSVLQAAVVPRIQKHATFDRYPLALGFDRTNNYDAWLLRGSRALSESSSLEFSALHRASEGSTVGMGLSQLFGDSVVVGLDLANAPSLPDASGRRSATRATRAALSVAWTIPSGPTLTVERFYSQDAYSASGWNELRGSQDQPPSTPFLSYLATRGGLMELTTRNSYFALMNWARAFNNPNVELLAAISWNPVDRSRYLEAGLTWHVGTSTSLQLLMERNQGGPNSQYGVLPIRSAATLELRLNF